MEEGAGVVFGLVGPDGCEEDSEGAAAVVADGYAAGFAPPDHRFLGDFVASFGAEFVGGSAGQLDTGVLPALGGIDGDEVPAWLKWCAGCEVEGHARDVVAVFHVADEELPLFGECLPIVADERSELVGEVTGFDGLAEGAKAFLISRMEIEEGGDGPAPGVGFVVLVGGSGEVKDFVQRQGFSFGIEVLDLADASPAGDVFAGLGHDAHGELSVFPLMSAEEFSSSFHVPGRTAGLEDGIHEAVCALVEDEVASVVGRVLFVEPEVIVDGVAVGKGGQVIWQHSGSAESVTVLHEEAGHLPVRVFCRIDREVVAPDGEGLVEDGGQLFDLRIVGQVGEECQSFSRDLADAFLGSLGFVDFRSLDARYELSGAIVDFDEVGEGAFGSFVSGFLAGRALGEGAEDHAGDYERRGGSGAVVCRVGRVEVVIGG